MEQEKIVWDDRLKLGVEVVDKAHAKLFRIMEKMMDMSMDAGSGQHTYKEAMKYLQAYSMTHFVEEEAYMRAIHFSGYAQHKQIHDTFRDKTLVSLRDDLERSGYSPLAMQRFVGILQRWLLEHIMRDDQAIVGKTVLLKHDDPPTQISILSRIVDRSVRDVFNVEAKLVSTDYKGQNIGKGYYCRRCYDLEGKIKVQFLLGVEELLLLRGANKALALRMMRRNEIEDQLALQIFGRLFDKMGKLFHAEEEKADSQDSRLTKDEFRADFMKGYPCRLLYSTKAGYLIFCYKSWRVKDLKAEGTEKEKAETVQADSRPAEQEAMQSWTEGR